MIAIFTIEKDALIYADKIHEYLKTNREGYNAERWCIPIFDEINNLWGIKMPIDYPEDSKLSLQENSCIGVKYYDDEDVEILPIKTMIEGKEEVKYYDKGAEVSPMDLKHKTVLTTIKL